MFSNFLVVVRHFRKRHKARRWSSELENEPKLRNQNCFEVSQPLRRASVQTEFLIVDEKQFCSRKIDTIVHGFVRRLYVDWFRFQPRYRVDSDKSRCSYQRKWTSEFRFERRSMINEPETTDTGRQGSRFLIDVSPSRWCEERRRPVWQERRVKTG